MNKNKVYQIKFYVFILSAFSLFVYFVKRKESSIKKNLKITPGWVYKITSGYQSGINIDCYYYVKGKRYKVGSKVLANYFTHAKKFEKVKIPVAYDSLFPARSELLIGKLYFEKFNLPFPDSLGWIDELKY